MNRTGSTLPADLKSQRGRFPQREAWMPSPKIVDEIIPLRDGATTPGDALARGKAKKSRTSLPRMVKLMEWGIVKEGMVLHIKNYDDSEAVVQDTKTVKFKDRVVRFNDWGQQVTGWSSICIYDWATTPDGQTLSELRAQRMEAKRQSWRRTRSPLRHPPRAGIWHRSRGRDENADEPEARGEPE